MTPEKLRERGRKLLRDTNEADCCDCMFAASAAWEADRKHIEALEKAICAELCECGSFDYPAQDEHDRDCPYFKFVAALTKED
jgi:hypothetical protein